MIRLLASLALFICSGNAFAQWQWWNPININTVEAQSDGKILALGYFDAFSGLEGKQFVRLHPDGLIDHSFTPALPSDPYTSINALFIQPDDKILLGLANSNGIVRLHADGTRDQSFQLDWTPANWSDYAYPVGLQNDGKLIALGQFSYIHNEATNHGFARFDTNGAFDPAFMPQFSFQEQPTRPYHAILQPDGKILVTGQFDKINNQSVGWTARLHQDGSLDPSFSSDTNIYSYNQFYDVQPDGKFIMSGPLGLVRFNSDGTLDARFNPGLGVFGTNRYVAGARVQRGTNILVFGRFEAYDAFPRKSIARVHHDGTLEPTFDAGLDLRLPAPIWQQNLLVNSVKVLPDQSFIVAGYFTHVLGLPGSSILRFTADGQIDLSFQAFQPTMHHPSFTHDGYYQFHIEGHRGRSYRVEASTDLETWEPLRNFIITTVPFHYIDLRPPSGLNYYRITAL